MMFLSSERCARGIAGTTESPCGSTRGCWSRYTAPPLGRAILPSVTAQYFRIFLWHVLRYLWRHPLLGLLNILSVALGVAVFLATQIANQSANRAFAASVDLLAGKAELEITSPSRQLPETILPRVTAAAEIAGATPLVHGFLPLRDFPGDYLEILGIDIFTNAPFRTFDPANFDASSFDIERWLGRPNTIAVSEEFVRQHSLKPGDKIRVRAAGREAELEIGFLMRKDDSFDPHFAAMDIGWAQELFGRRGELNSIQLKLRNPRERDAAIAALRPILPQDARVAAPSRRTEEVEKILGGFQLNLALTSLVSLFVGMFLIYNTVSASVVRRQHEIGILRSLGVTRREVRMLSLGEAIVLGGIGSFLGLLGGVALARVLTAAVSTTISSLYVLVSVRELALPPWMFGLAWGAGVASVILSAWFPARQAARQKPVEALHGGMRIERSELPSLNWLLGGLACLSVSAIFSWLALSTGPRWLSFVAAFGVIAGFSLLVPRLMFRLSRSAGDLCRARRSRGRKVRMETELAAANLRRALLRNSVTVAALAIAVAMTVGVSVMVFSFRKTVEAWINQTLLADLFITPAANEAFGDSAFFPPGAFEFLARHGAVETADTFRAVEVPMGETDVMVAVITGARREFQFFHGDRATLMRRFQEEPCVFVSESFARRHRVRENDVLPFATPEGPRSFAVAAIFYDYTRDQGVVYLSAANFVRFWHDNRVHSVAVYLKNGHPAEEVMEAFRSQFGGSGQFAIFSNQSLRKRIFEIFDQTFAVTYVLLAISIFVAVTGIFLSLTILIAERSRELAILRAIGGSAGQVRRLLFTETAMLGLVAAGVGLVCGLCLALVLTGVINRVFFGWTIHLAFPWRNLAWTPVWILVAAIIAAIVPAWRASRMELAANLRDE
jgi:putative ABC transport system permease protein